MFERFKTLSIFGKFVIIMLSIFGVCFAIVGILNIETRIKTIEGIIVFLILIFWLIIYNKFNCVKNWFETNKLRIILTMVVAEIFLYINNNTFISESFTEQIIRSIASCILAMLFIEFDNRKLIDERTTIFMIISICVLPNLILVKTLSALTFLLIVVVAYCFFGIIINLVKHFRIEKSIIIDILALFVSIVSILIDCIM